MLEVLEMVICIFVKDVEALCSHVLLIRICCVCELVEINSV